MIKSSGDEPGLVEYALGEIPSKIAAESAIHDWNRFSPAQKRLVCELLILEIKYSGSEGTIEVRFREDGDRWRSTSDGESCSIPFCIRNGRHGKKRLVFGSPPIIPPLSQGRIPLASRLLAQAIHLDELRRSGIIRNQSEMANDGSVTRARVSQIMNLLNLASAIQEEILF